MAGFSVRCHAGSDRRAHGLTPRERVNQPRPDGTPHRVPPKEPAENGAKRTARTPDCQPKKCLQLQVLRVRTFLTRPAVSGVLLALLIYSLWRVPSADTTTCSVRGWTLPGLKVSKAEPFSAFSVFLVRDGAGFRVEDLEKSSTQGLLDAMEKNPDDVIRAILTYERHAAGLYDVTSFRDEYTITLRPFRRTPLTSDESARAKAAFVGWLASKSGGNMLGIAESLSPVGEQRVILNWPGIANTALAIIGWSLFAVSLGWVAPAARAWRKRRSDRALGEGRCPRCGYAIYGLRDGVCPECGKPFPV